MLSTLLLSSAAAIQVVFGRGVPEWPATIPTSSGVARRQDGEDMRGAIVALPAER